MAVFGNFFPAAGQLSGRLQVLLVKIQFCRIARYVNIEILVIYAGHLSDRIKYFVKVFTDRLALFMKTAMVSLSKTL